MALTTELFKFFTLTLFAKDFYISNLLLNYQETSTKSSSTEIRPAYTSGSKSLTLTTELFKFFTILLFVKNFYISFTPQLQRKKYQRYLFTILLFVKNIYIQFAPQLQRNKIPKIILPKSDFRILLVPSQWV